eukprot:4903065-Alexandrium_andersonii.AAC.1
MASDWNSGASPFANMRRRGNQGSSASSGSAGPTRGGEDASELRVRLPEWEVRGRELEVKRGR